MSDERIPDAFAAVTEDEPFAPLGQPRPERSATAAQPADPLKLCVATTVALIAWLITPALAVVVFSAMALFSYARARRAGLLASRCALGDTRLVMAYLALAFAGGVTATLLKLF